MGDHRQQQVEGKGTDANQADFAYWGAVGGQEWRNRWQPWWMTSVTAFATPHKSAT